VYTSEIADQRGIPAQLVLIALKLPQVDGR
jgi:hypothetical protein